MNCSASTEKCTNNSYCTYSSFDFGSQRKIHTDNNNNRTVQIATSLLHSNRKYVFHFYYKICSVRARCAYCRCGSLHRGRIVVVVVVDRCSMDESLGYRNHITVNHECLRAIVEMVYKRIFERPKTRICCWMNGIRITYYKSHRFDGILCRPSQTIVSSTVKLNVLALRTANILNCACWCRMQSECGTRAPSPACKCKKRMPNE